MEKSWWIIKVKINKDNKVSNKKIEGMVDYLIIGNSASGLAAAESIRDTDKKGRLVVLTEEEYTNYSKPLITYYLAGKVSLGSIYFKPESFYKDNNIELLTSTKIKSIDTEKLEAVTGSGDRIKYKKLLIASGGRPIVPRIKISGRSGKTILPFNSIDSSNYSEVGGIFTLTTLEDSIRIKNYIEKNEIKNITILGGGLIGLKSAEAFLEIGLKINIVELADRILAATFDSQASGIIENAIESTGSRIYKNNTIDEIFTGSGRICGYRLRDGRENDCDLLVIAIGVNPDLGFIKEGMIETSRGIKVDRKMQTSVDNVYASGDIIEGFDILLEENRNIAIWPLAVRQGNIAGSNMAGNPVDYEGGFFMNSVEILGIPSVSMGVTNLNMQDDNNIEIKKDFRPNQNLYKKIVIKDNKIIGVIMVGNIERAGIYSGLIKNKIDLSGVKENIFREDFGIIHLPAEYKKHLV
ncbi:MAG: FAD-dependent oxidoreductase, partial [Actinobacteria bacterium]|nr:FAD-dependent oxidoreductase [Actinomycetota bacterium]